ncbi:MAG: HlyD family efflux transporter periplasmic adaptor subunit [Synechococcaceae cyanobacterium]|nr:HlyD family efflux transporter periplasmic adaptor subunit [Synechococcaceae cyanobacterium]
MALIPSSLRSGRGIWWLATAVVLLLVVAGARLLPQRTSKPAPHTSTPAQRAGQQAVSALGRLEPAGDTRRLAAPITGIGGSPRITELLVEEGQRVNRGQLLARFDNGPNQRAERRLLLTRIANLEQRLPIERRNLARYRQLSRAGALPSSELDSRVQRSLELEGQLLEARAELVRIETDLVNTELRAPIDGVVLRLHARTGERPVDAGILELGASDRMEAVVEVYESDIDRVRLDQHVVLVSENGGFGGQLRGQVSRISPQVRQRQVLTTDPSGDADARIVEVRVRLEPADAERVSSLAGMKVIARLEA